MTSPKPLPPIDAESRAYWAACNDNRLVLQVCAGCGHRQHYHRRLCARCGAVDLADLDASGAGTIRSFTIIRRAVSSAFEADVPYVVALVTLAEGPTVMANILDAPLDGLAIGAPVALVFERRSEEINVPQFRWAPER